MPPPPRTDEIGNVLPSDNRVRRAFAEAFKLRAVADTLEDEADELRRLQDEPVGGRIDDQLVSDLRIKAKHLREFCTPYAVCPACEAKRVGVCKACRDRGWMTKSALKIWKDSTE